MTRVNHTAFRFAIALCGLLFALPLGMKALPIAPPPETPEAFLQRMGPALERDTTISKIRKEFESITVTLPRLDFRDATLQDAVDQLNKVISDHNSEQSAFQIPPLRIGPELVLNTEPVIPATNKAAPPGAGNSANATDLSAVPGKSAAPRPSSSPWTFTLSLAKIPFPEALRYILTLSGRMVDIEPDGIWLKPVSFGVPTLVKCIYIIPATVCPAKVDVEKLVGIEFHDYDPKSGMTYWGFDERSRLLTLQYGNSFFPDFELRYARELLKHGFRPAGAPPK